MKTLLFTGASGFLGSNILPELRDKYDVTTIGRRAGCDLHADLAAGPPVLPRRYDCVLHAAGLAHKKPAGEAASRAFFDVNAGGTRNLCTALASAGTPHSIVYISSVAVYGCEEGSMLDESTPLAGSSPYARSKIMAEEFLSRWCVRHGVVLTILRPPLIAGVNPPGNLGAMIRGIRRGYYLDIAGGRAGKSILMAADIARLLPLVEGRGGTYNVCDSRPVSVGELSALIARQSGRWTPLSIPGGLARTAGRIGDILKLPPPIRFQYISKLTKSLTFSNTKATTELRWQPLDVLTNFHI